ncbi:MarR family winged helix-turn-helix transcriptional regulator [Cryptosporangium aurantiacum]|uniref:DNA-binding transcriptional regulator, MarR family n=1 Tax=Cryptosporangium aurantiacum TaxID=134849 RepID=A0A1M7RCY7_9ACTN|nr:hypothetical protein [Cryptosporangium aurantiacum]SHN44009.1 hypothetical protein SAMN05443668_11014 [Cryptosporangium aurantiacum]
MTDERPIGYWVKSVDRLLEEVFERALTERRIARRHWQTMNVLAAGPRTVAEIAEQLTPFLGADTISAPEVLADLRELGWIAVPDGRYALTEDGQSALESLRAEVLGLRRQATDGVSDEDYRTTVATLRRMSENLHTVG